MSNYLKQHTVYMPSQAEPLDERQVLNAAGGYVYELDPFDAAKRFMILGTEGGTFYQNERDLTKGGIDGVKEAIAQDGKRVVYMARDISDSGKAAKNDMAIFVLVLAMTHGDQETKEAVKAVYNSVVRTGSHQLMFADFANDMRGWGRSLKRVVASWYENKSDDDLAFQTVKYQNRYGWTHKDVLRQCHGGRNTAIFRWIVGADTDHRIITNDEDANRRYEGVAARDTSENPLTYPDIVYGYERAKDLGNSDTATDKDMIRLINDDRYPLSHEMIPTRFKNSIGVWEALLPTMPPGALLRNLAKMTSIDMFPQLSDNVSMVLDKITPASVKKARLHPITVLGAMRVYASGEGVLGSLKWSPNNRILSRLEDAFYWAFETVEPCNKNLLLALDVSGSMFWREFSGIPIQAYPMLLAGEIAATLAMVTARVEQNFHICSFDDKFTELPITDKMSLSEVMNIVENLSHGMTDCALPMLAANNRRWHNVDGFCIYTDNETWFGDVHPKTALERYREDTGRDARLAVSAMTGTKKTIADGTVPYMLDFVGISTDTPRMISQYIAGEI